VETKLDEAADSKTIAPKCDECGNKARFIIHNDDEQWIAEPLE